MVPARRRSPRTAGGWLGVVCLSAATLAGGALDACTGSSATVPFGDDSGTDGSTSSSGSGSGASGPRDASHDTGGSSGSADASHDAASSSGSEDASQDSSAGDSSSSDGGAAACGPDGAACMDNGSAGLCHAGGCAACSDPSDDATCTAAYGGASSPYLCLAGVCTPGDCRTGADRVDNPAGAWRGVATPNVCGKCTADSQCAAASSAAPVCDTGTGACAAGSCPPDAGLSAGGAPGACPVNASDICCGLTCQPAPGSNPCCPGPGGDVYCAARLGAGATCVDDECTACTPALPGEYTVDPVHGSDGTGTGNTVGGAQPGCALETITRALQIIGTASMIQNTVTVLGSSAGASAVVGPGETFPLVVPQNVAITTAAGPVVVNVPAGMSGFQLGAGTAGAGTAAGILGGTGAALAIDGHGNTATYGIVVTTGSTASTKIASLTVSGFLDDGILVENAGVLSIGPGVTSTANGVATARKAGLHVTGSGHAIVSAPAGQAPTHFDGNTSHGIFVDASGFLTLTGAVTSATAGTGTVTANGNYAAGLWIQQTPGTPPQSNVLGLVSFGSTNGNGVRLFAGSSVKLRGSVSLGNHGSGVLVSATNTSSDITKIDLGDETGPDYGNNTLQQPQGKGSNGGAGVCLMVRPMSGTLHAAGNTFSAGNCATTAATLSANKAACNNAAGACPGGVCDLGIVGPGNDIDVKMCSHR